MVLPVNELQELLVVHCSTGACLAAAMCRGDHIHRVCVLGDVESLTS